MKGVPTWQPGYFLRCVAVLTVGELEARRDATTGGDLYSVSLIGHARTDCNMHGYMSCAALQTGKIDREPLGFAARHR